MKEQHIPFRQDSSVRLKYAVAVGIIGGVTLGVKGAIVGGVVGWFGCPKLVRWLYL